LHITSVFELHKLLGSTTVEFNKKILPLNDGESSAKLLQGAQKVNYSTSTCVLKTKLIGRIDWTGNWTYDRPVNCLSLKYDNFTLP